MSTADLTNAEGTTWVPICCDRVMRHSVFPGPGGKPAAGTLTCTVCGKHISLEPQHDPSLTDYGPGARIISLVGAPKAGVRKAAAVDNDIEETMA